MWFMSSHLHQLQRGAEMTAHLEIPGRLCIFAGSPCIVLYVCVDVSCFVTLMLAKPLRPLGVKRIWGSGDCTHCLHRFAEQGMDLRPRLREF